MKLTFDTVSSDEYDRMSRLYGPLTQAVRRLIDAGIRTDVDDETIRDAQAAIEAVAQTLERAQRDTTTTLLHAETGFPLSWVNPAVGLRNAIAPPMLVEHEADGSCWAELDLGLPYEGPPGLVHGGICALLLDQILGEAASAALTKPNVTGTITMRFLRGTPLGPLRAEAFIEGTEGVKTFVRGHLSDADGRTVEADGVFIRPAWARGEGGLERSDPGMPSA